MNYPGDHKEEEFFNNAEAKEEMPPEHSEKPEAPPKKKNPLLALIIIVLSLVLFNYLRSDTVYFFKSTMPVDLGSTSDSQLYDKELPTNSYVTVRGVPDTRRVRGKRGSDSYEYFVLMGSWIVVQRKVSEEEHDSITISETEVKGRLLEITKGGRYDAVWNYLVQNLGFDELGKQKVYMLIADEAPGQRIYYLALDLILLVLVLVNVISLIGYLKQKIADRKVQ